MNTTLDIKIARLQTLLDDMQILIGEIQEQRQVSIQEQSKLFKHHQEHQSQNLAKVRDQFQIGQDVQIKLNSQHLDFTDFDGKVGYISSFRSDGSCSVFFPEMVLRRTFSAHELVPVTTDDNRYSSLNPGF